MIFTGFKRKSNQIFLRNRLPQLLEESNKDTAKKVKKVIVILDDVAHKNSILKEIVNTLEIDDKNVDCILFQRKISKENIEEGLICPKDFGWYGKIKSNHLKSVLTKKYDLLINYSKVDDLYVNLLILQSKSDFKAGFAHLDNRFYDLLIECKLNDFKSFNVELKKYLKILKKIL